MTAAPRIIAILVVGILGSCAGDDTSPDVSGTEAPASRSAPSAASAVPSEDASEAPSDATGAGVYLAIGDSITFGIGVPDPQEQGYAARVGRALADSATAGETRVFAVPGETASGFLERRLDDVLRAVEAAGPQVEVVTIGLGANELLRTRRDPACLEDRASAACDTVVDAALTGAIGALDTIVESVQAALVGAGSDARVLLLAYYNPDPDPLARRTLVGTDGVVGCDDPGRPGLNDRIACVAESRGAELVDLHAAFVGRELELTRFADGDVHPNAAGYEVIADTILDVIEAGAGEP